MKWLTYQYGKISRINSTVHAGNRTKNILILDKGSTHVLDDAIIIKETEIYLRLHYNRSKRIYHFEVNDSVINGYPLCLGNISKYFTGYNINKTGLY